MKKTLPIDFALEDLQYLCKMAGFTFKHPPEVDPEYLARVEKDRQLSPCPKYQRDVDKAIRTVLSDLIWCIRSGPGEEGEVQS